MESCYKSNFSQSKKIYFTGIYAIHILIFILVRANLQKKSKDDAKTLHLINENFIASRTGLLHKEKFRKS